MLAFCKMEAYVRFIICFLVFSAVPARGRFNYDVTTTQAVDVRAAKDGTTVSPTPGAGRDGTDNDATTTEAANARSGEDETTTLADGARSDEDDTTATPTPDGARGGNDKETTTTADGARSREDFTATTEADDENRAGDEKMQTTTVASRSGDEDEYETTTAEENRNADDTDKQTTTAASRDGSDNDAETTTASYDGPIQQRSFEQVPYKWCPENMKNDCLKNYKCQIVVDSRAGDEKEYHCIEPKCSENRCSNKGDCVGSDECYCNEGFQGENCSEEEPRKGDDEPKKKPTGCPRSSNPCPEGKRCVKKGAEITCLSYACESSPCKNDGVCQETSIDGMFICKCQKGYEGLTCDSKPEGRSWISGGQINKGISSGFDRCSVPPKPCLTGERCEMINSRVVCTPARCSMVTCSGRGTCVEERNGYRCVCQQGYIGVNCERKRVKFAGPCDPNPCKGDCTCHESCQHEYGYYCASNGGYMGKNCTIPVPKIRCGQRSISIDVPEALYTEFDKKMQNTFFYVSQSSTVKSLECEATNVGGMFHFEMPLPFTRCGTIRMKTNEALVVKNRIFVDRRSSFFSMAVPIVEFECRYERQYRLVTSVKPVVSQPSTITKNGQFAPEVELCKVASCQRTCPQKFRVNMGAMYTVGEKIHLSTTALPQTGFMDYVTTITSMTLSCSASSGASAGLRLITNGCQANSGLATTYGIGQRACVSFQTPRALGCASAYIHLHLQLCSPSEIQSCGSGGMQRCGSGFSGRKRRSSEEMEKEGYVVVGPLLIINGSEGAEKMVLYPEASRKAPVYVNEIKMNEIYKGSPRKNVTRFPETGGDNNLTILSILVPVAIVVFFYIVLMYAWHKSNNRICSSFPTKRRLVARRPRIDIHTDTGMLCEIASDVASLPRSPATLQSAMEVKPLCRCEPGCCNCLA